MIGLIIVNAFSNNQSLKYNIERLKEEFLKKDIVVDVLKNDCSFFFLENGNIKCNLPKYDFIVYLDKDRYTARILEKCNYRLFNNATAIEICDDKMLTHIFLSNNDIKMPKTMSSPLIYNNNYSFEYIDKIEQQIGYPMIIKENYGSLGMQVYFSKNHQETISIAKRIIPRAHIYQEFIESSKGVDFRIIVIGHKIVAYMKRENVNSYLSNLASGGSSYNVELPESYKDVAIRASKILNLDYCGVDLLKGRDGEPILSEVNSNAFFEGIEKTTNVNVAAKYVDFIISEVVKNEHD